MKKIEIKQITSAEDPVLETVSKWICDWWEETGAYDKERMLAYYKRSVFPDRFPQTFVAFVNDKPVGTFQFGMGDTFVRPDLYPWLKHVYVVPEYRKLGCATEMMKYAAEKICAANENFYLFTHLKGFYERFGWEFVEEFESYDPDLGIQRMYVFNTSKERD